MKRNAIYMIMVSLLAVLLGSCRMDVPVDGDGIATLVLTATVNDCMDSDTKASGDGSLANLNGNYRLRCFMEIWSADGMTLEYSAPVQYFEFKEGEITGDIKYEISLIARKYMMVMWADIVKVKEQDGQVEVEEEYYKKGENLSSISVPPAAAFGPDVYDAFTGTGEIDLTAGSKVTGLTLKRPLAKVRVIDNKTGNSAALNGKYSTSLAFGAEGINIPKSYNAVTGSIGYHESKLIETPRFPSVYEEGVGLCLYSGYVLVPAEGDNFNFNIVVKKKNEDNSEAADVQVSRIPLKQNTLTTVKGTVIR